MVLWHIARFPDTTFLLLTKNQKRYYDFIDIMPNDVFLGATIETDDYIMVFLKKTLYISFVHNMYWVNCVWVDLNQTFQLEAYM